MNETATSDTSTCVAHVKAPTVQASKWSRSQFEQILYQRLSAEAFPAQFMTIVIHRGTLIYCCLLKGPRFELHDGTSGRAIEGSIAILRPQRFQATISQQLQPVRFGA